jgi:peptide/nickel transport system permease protein
VALSDVHCPSFVVRQLPTGARGVTLIGRLVVTRLVDACVLLLLLSLIAFGALKLSRGDLVDALYGSSLDQLDPAQVAQIREHLGLNRPLPAQYLGWLQGIVHGDLGRANGDQRPVLDIIGERLPYTAQLGGTALVLALSSGLLLGVLSAARPGSAIDRLTSAFAAAATAVPGFWLALGLILVFGVWLRWLPTGQPFSTFTALPGWLDRLDHLALPAITLAARESALFARYTRSSLADVMHADFVRTARAKGLPDRIVVWRHALRNALTPLITLVGLELPTLVGGAVAIEVAFGWPGMGQLFVDAALKRDYALLAGNLLVTSTLVIVGNFLADLTHGWADPRLRSASNLA